MVIQWKERAQQLARKIPCRNHPDQRAAIHRWACALQQALYQDRIPMTLSDLDHRHIIVPTTTPDYSGQFERNVLIEERLRQIEQRLTNMEILVRLQQDDLK